LGADLRAVPADGLADWHGRRRRLLPQDRFRCARRLRRTPGHRGGRRLSVGTAPPRQTARTEAVPREARQSHRFDAKVRRIRRLALLSADARRREPSAGAAARRQRIHRPLLVQAQALTPTPAGIATEWAAPNGSDRAINRACRATALRR